MSVETTVVHLRVVQCSVAAHDDVCLIYFCAGAVVCFIDTILSFRRGHNLISQEEHISRF